MAVAVWGWTLAFRAPRIIDYPGVMDLLIAQGIPVEGMMFVGLVMPVLLAAVVAIVIFLGRRDDRIAMIFGLALVCVLAWGSGATVAIRAAAPDWLAPMRVVDTLWAGLGFVGFVTFPNGRFVPRWMGWGVVLALLGLLAFPDAAISMRSIGGFAGGGSDSSPGITIFVLYAVILLMASQVVRYRKYFDDVERRQSRLVLLALTLAYLPVGTGFVLMASSNVGLASWFLLVAALAAWLIPAALGVAIFRYRLYDIDRIVSVSVSYVLVVALVAGIYGAGVILLRQLIPGQGDLPVAASTLAVAALFNPLRRRVRAAVDKRFHRSRYDAELILADFAERLHQRVDLTGMIDESVAVVRATMNPVHASLWLPAVKLSR
jgi:hypothetical protein